MTYHCEFHDRKATIAKRVLGFVPQINGSIILDGNVYKVLSVAHDLDQLDTDVIVTFIIVKKQ